MTRLASPALVLAIAATACSTSPPPTKPETPVVATEPAVAPPTSPAPAIAEPEPTCPEGRERTENGCEPTKVAACNRLIAAINDEQEPLKQATGSDPAALRELADLLSHVAGKVGMVELTDPTLVGHRDDYAAMATELAASARATAAALERNDPAGAAAAAEGLSSFGSRESTLVDDLNRYCGYPVREPLPAAKGPFPASTHAAMTNPKLAKAKAPRHFAVRFDTTVGTFTVKCDRSWAPHGADRFYNLVAIGYFDDVAFFRAVKGFVVQFGIHGDPAVNAAWKKENLTPDVVKASNDAGTLTFAQAGQPAGPGMTADSRSVQLFFNLTDNTRLDAMGFAPLCKVTSGMDVVESIHTGHGEKAGRDQGNIQAEGNAYLRQNYPELDYIESARLVGP